MAEPLYYHAPVRPALYQDLFSHQFLHYSAKTIMRLLDTPDYFQVGNLDDILDVLGIPIDVEEKYIRRAKFTSLAYNRHQEMEHFGELCCLHLPLFYQQTFLSRADCYPAATALRVLIGALIQTSGLFGISVNDLLMRCVNLLQEEASSFSVVNDAAGETYERLVTEFGDSLLHSGTSRLGLYLVVDMPYEVVYERVLPLLPHLSFVAHPIIGFHYNFLLALANYDGKQVVPFEEKSSTQRYGVTSARFEEEVEVSMRRRKLRALLSHE